jgi:glycosyltransferase involved in cell wall biosynthesis
MTKKTSVLIYGPYADEYSLAKVNRGLALGLSELVASQGLDYEVTIGARAGEVSRLPTANDLKRYPFLKKLAVEIKDGDTWDIAIYNNFPKDPNSVHGLAELPGTIKAAFLAWEEDRFPKRWVDEYNQHLDLVLAASQHTARVLKRSGVKVPVLLLPNGLNVDFLESKPSGASRNKVAELLKGANGYRFFHNSSGLERKSPEELIKAYTKAFSASDDVTLIIKSYPNATNRFPDLLKEFGSKQDLPQIIYIEEDLSDEGMVALYETAHCYVSPSRAEGFNLPALEAMHLGIPVITTGWSGQLDFCDDSNSYLLDYKLVPAKSHLDNPGAYWAKVDEAHLSNLMQQAKAEFSSPVQLGMVERARITASAYTWTAAAEKLVEFLDDSLALKRTKVLKLGVISTFNSVCGIAEYSKYLYGNLGGGFSELYFLANRDAIGRVEVDPDNVKRLWEYGETDFKEVLAWLDEEKANTGDYPFQLAHIQYSVGFYTYSALAALIKGLTQRGIETLLTAHSVQVPGAELGIIREELALLKQIHVLNTGDLEYLQDLGLHNCHYFPHGNAVFPYQPHSRLKRELGLPEGTGPIIATHGFIVENKGLLETVAALGQLKSEFPDMLYLALNAINPRNMTSQSLKEDFENELAGNGLSQNTLLYSDFLDRSEILVALAAADVIVFAYPEAKETASGAIRLAMAASRPVIITKSSQFKDLQDYAYVVEDNQPATIAAAIRELVGSAELSNQVVSRLRAYSITHSWDHLALKYLNLVSKAYSAQ